jgi:AraC-like DNA-binding protein
VVQTGLIFESFSVRLDQLSPLLALNELCLMQAVAEGFYQPKLYPAASTVARECHRLLGELPSQAGLDHRIHLLRIAASPLAAEFKASHLRLNGFARTERHLLEALASLPLTEIMRSSVEELSHRFRVGHRQVNRLLKKRFGFSLGGLKMEARLLLAASLLRDPDLKVIHVAEQAEFHHLGLFNTCFKRRFGASPSEWRRRSLLAGSETISPVDGNAACRFRANGLCPWSANPHAS